MEMNRMMRLRAFFIAFAAVGMACSSSWADTQPVEKPLHLELPTANQHLFDSHPEKFYMYTYRMFEGVKSKPWTAGQYGFVRTLRRTEEGVIATKFHEGIDVRPTSRDAAGRPKDLVGAIAAGKVVYTNPSAGGSNYGRYVVIEHDWGTGKFYSLYAHLAEVSCKVGARVYPGTIIGKMGYSGAGINRERAHLHLELNVLIHREFSDWHKHYFGTSNKHGMYNGLNMAGLNIAELLRRQHKNKALRMSEFLPKIPVYYKITIPRHGELDIAKRYPWMRKGNHAKASPSWEISFASTGFPLAIAPSMRQVSKPTVTYVKPTRSRQTYHTKGLLSGTGSSAKLTSRGLRSIALIAGTFPRIKKTAPPKAVPVH